MIDVRKRKGRSYMKKKIYVCAPFGENLQEELQNAKTYYEYVFSQGGVPVGPHAYAMMLGCENEQEKKQMRRAGMGVWRSSNGEYARGIALLQKYET